MDLVKYIEKAAACGMAGMALGAPIVRLSYDTDSDAVTFADAIPDITESFGNYLNSGTATVAIVTNPQYLVQNPFEIDPHHNEPFQITSVEWKPSPHPAHVVLELAGQVYRGTKSSPSLAESPEFSTKVKETSRVWLPTAATPEYYEFLFSGPFAPAP